MDIDDNLLNEVEAIYKAFRKTYSYALPKEYSQLIKLYKELVEECEEGYSSSIYEWDDEIVWRDYIDDFINYIANEKSDLAVKISKSIHAIDNRLKQVFLVSPIRSFTGRNTAWWYQGILSKAQTAYANNVRDHYSMNIEIVN